MWTELIFTGLCLVSSVICIQCALADDSQKNMPDASTIQNSPLKITVRKEELNLEELRDIGLDLKHTLTATRHLYDEVTLQPVSLQMEPEMIANGVIISIPIGTQPIGPPAPPRKERVDMLMNEIRPVIALLKKNVDDLVAGNKQLEIPDPLKSKLDPQFTLWISLVNDLDSQLKKLDSLTPGPTYDNYAIASVATTIQEDIKQLEEVRKTTYKLMRREGKELAQ